MTGRHHLFNVHLCTCMVIATPVEMHAYFQQKMHMHSCMRAYAIVQKLLCHGSYCELILSLVRVSCRLLLAVRPAAVSTESVTQVFPTDEYSGLKQSTTFLWTVLICNIIIFPFWNTSLIILDPIACFRPTYVWW